MRKIIAFLVSVAIVASIITVAPIAASAEITGSVAVQETASVSGGDASDFSWDNASVYFLLTDRFNNGNTSNDHSYNRGLDKDGAVTTKMRTDAASFQGGDFAGITQKITQGYFNDLGVNVLWISAPYEQIRGYCCTGNGKSSFPHYSYHGYYAGDYSCFDQNFGTEEEFRTMVDAAHKNGLRVVLDIVMNHPGYNTMYDMNEFGFGLLKDGWEDEYYTFSGDNNTYHNYITYTGIDSSVWGSWWGTGWLRAGLSGYTAPGKDDLTGSAGGELPDFITESADEVPVPEFLQTKWQSEGTYDQKTSNLDSWFSANNRPKTVRNYLCYWLSQYVENYGIDGFRCDTAKHVEKESWAALKETCSQALKTWRLNNPDKAGADWDEDFWMTAEVYGKCRTGPSDEYFTEAKFDSTINFEFSGSKGVTQVDGVNATYEKFAANINGYDNYNVLTYISSHDTSLCGRLAAGTHNADSLIYQGSALQLLPGAIQIFYGDESGREYVTHSISSIMTNIRSGDHDVRSFMNWDSTDEKVLKHWQKVGKFRSSHIAVGAGSHTSLESTSGAAFERTYDKNGISDKVLCCIGADADTPVTITVDAGNFPNGTLLTNAYDGSVGKVRSGKVTFNSGENGTILCAVSGFDPKVDVEAITVNASSNTVSKGKTAILTATITPAEPTDSSLTWTSSNEAVAVVDTNGVVTAVGKGTATITASADDGSGIKGEINITVTQPVTRISVKKSATVNVKGTVSLNAVVSPSDADNKGLTWTSLNAKVAKVNAKGVVTGVSRGTANIKAAAKDGSGKSAICRITVKQPVTKIAVKKAKKNVTNKTVKIKVKSKTTLKAVVSPSSANNKAVKWTTSKKKVATVSQKGVVKGLKKGKAIIKAVARDGSGKSAKVILKVTK